MSKCNIRNYWPFSQVKLKEIKVTKDGKVTLVKLEPNKCFLPVCSQCKQKVKAIHSYHTRLIHDLTMADSIVFLELRYRKVRCPNCGIHVEYHDFVEPYSHFTKRFIRYIFELCNLMTITDVAKHLHLSWDQVKRIDKLELKKLHKNPNYKGLRVLCVDEISHRKHHNYLTIIANYLTGEVLDVVKNRDCEALIKFLKKLPDRNRIEAVAMDMWDPYIKAIKEQCHKTQIVFDKFHVISAYGKIIDKIRNREYLNANSKSKKLIKGSRYLLLKNPENLKPKERPRIKQIINMNKNIAITYLLKDYLKRLWKYKYKKCARKFLYYWCVLAFESGITELIKFAKMLLKYSYGIINHCTFAIHNSKLEGINNKIKVIKRKAYGYHDIEYFKYKIIQSTCN